MHVGKRRRGGNEGHIMKGGQTGQELKILRVKKICFWSSMQIRTQKRKRGRLKPTTVDQTSGEEVKIQAYIPEPT